MNGGDAAQAPVRRCEGDNVSLDLVSSQECLGLSTGGSCLTIFLHFVHSSYSLQWRSQVNDLISPSSFFSLLVNNEFLETKKEYTIGGHTIKPTNYNDLSNQKPNIDNNFPKWTFNPTWFFSSSSSSCFFFFNFFLGGFLALRYYVGQNIICHHSGKVHVKCH